MKGCLIALAVFIVLSGIGLGIYFYNQRTRTAGDFETEKPVITDIEKKTVATGSIKPRLEIAVKPQVSGVIDELFVEEGQLVTKGDKLARIKLVPSEVNVNSAQNNVDLARLRLQEARRELERQQTINQRNLDVETARANYENAKQEEERQRALLEEGVISQQEYNRFLLDLNLARADYENAKIVARNTVKQFKTQVDIAEQELAAAINNLQLLREGAARNSRQVANIVTATVNGMVLDVPVKEGSSVIERNNFNEGTTIATLADMSNLIFEGQVDESDVGQLREGMPLKLTVGAISDYSFGALLEFISPKGEDVEGTVKFEVRAAVQPTDSVFLRAGYSANGDIILDRKEQVLAIKERDVIYKGDTTYVELLVGEREFERHPVKTGLSDGILVEIVEGLDTTHQVKVLKGPENESEQ